MRLAAVLVALLAACSDDGSNANDVLPRRAAEERARADLARAEQARAEEMARLRERETAELKAHVEGLIAAMTEDDAQMSDAERQLAAATTQADRDAVRARIDELRRQQRELQTRLDKIKAGVKLKCPPDQPLC